MHSIRALMAVLPFAALPAFAQDTAPAQVEIEDDTMMIEPFALSVGDLEDMDVYGEGDEQIGEVEEVLADASGSPTALVVETEGFIGIGDEDVVLPLDQVQLVEDRFVTGLTEDELEALPEWED